ncbi:putative DNA primase/helicase [Amycolatopsis sulphurea]|uniref:Putative DNA primase/helicase n=1 Tax=Amycolatopsis sulphurea TaxID=76022 RepID=A0A2A9FCE0_9PSEU|nr:phage/plasmid primase, P4 family [Amycolatopsis sulphurea]PFG48099.1 putative DNA primase/helicase [Amycolatopsis sulphurea]
MHVDALLQQLGGGAVLEDRGGVLVTCPAHKDGRPSLFVSLKPDGRALIHCRAGCSADAVLTAAGLRTADLFRVTGEPTLSDVPPVDLDPGAVAALMQYVTAAASRLPSSESAAYAFERFGVTEDMGRELQLGYDDGTVNTPGRDFRTQAYTAHPRLVVPMLDWHGTPRGLQGRDVGGACPARWVNLASPAEGMRWSATGVFRTSGSFDTVLVAEGPGDALTAVAAGYTAVAVRGSGVARSARTARELVDGAAEGARFVLAGDNDRSGREFNEALGARLAELGRPSRVLTIPAGRKDLADWRAAEKAAFAAALHQAVSDAPAWTAPEKTPPKPARPRRERVPMEGTDIANARRALDIVGADTAYVDGVGFLTWTGKVWSVMSTTRERAIGHRVADAMTAELAEVREAHGGDSLAYKEALKTARRMHMDSGIRAALEHLRTITGHDVEDFDAHPHLLTFNNGTVDLRTGQLRAHARDDRLTKLIRADFDPDAQCPRWTQFLGEIFPDDPELPGYMRRLIGYGITGETREHVFALLYGHGSNGKSVFVNSLADVLRGITGHVSQAAVAYQRSYDPGAANPALAALRGVRLAVLSELSEGLRLNEALLKQLTAGDPVTARELYKGIFTFNPTALMLMATNYRPDVRGQDDGFWRRTRLIPFVRSFSDADKDPMLSRALLAEAPGILAWAVQGAAEWYAGGLREPASVRAAVAEYRQQSDLLDGFLPGVLVHDPEGSILQKQAWDMFQNWRDEEQVMQVLRWGPREFTRNLESRKVKSVRANAGKKLIGVRAARPDEIHAG